MDNLTNPIGEPSGEERNSEPQPLEPDTSEVYGGQTPQLTYEERLWPVSSLSFDDLIEIGSFDRPDLPTPPCSFCEKPLGEFELTLNHKWHKECQVCEFCKGEVTHELAIKALKKERLPAHQPCQEKKIEEDYKQKPVVIKQWHLDYLNEVRLRFDHLLKPNPELSVADNVKTTEDFYATDFKWLHKADLETIFIALKKAEKLTALLSITLDKDKEKVRTELQRKDLARLKKEKDLAAIESAQEYRTDTEKAKRERGERLNPEVAKQKKAIAALMKVGYTEVEATETILAELAKRAQATKS